MINFVLYNIFSGLEFLSVFLLAFSMFNVDYKYYIKETMIATVSLTLFSYLLVITNTYKIIPMPLFITGFIFLIIKFLFKRKTKYALVVSMGVSLAYGIIQVGIVNLSVAFGYISDTDINNPFLYKIYILQFICAMIAFTTSLFLKNTNGGFGFELRGSNDTSFVLTVFLVFFTSSILSHYLLSYVTLFVSVLMSSLIFIVLAFRRENEEFTL